MNPWPWFWAAWGAAGVLIESAAFYGRRRPKDTLSRNVQALVCAGIPDDQRGYCRRRPWLRAVSLAGWLGFSVWFADHIWG